MAVMDYLRNTKCYMCTTNCMSSKPCMLYCVSIIIVKPSHFCGSSFHVIRVDSLIYMADSVLCI